MGMATIRLQVDGAEALIDAETIEMPVQRLDGRPRYLVGLVLALATGAVAIGALGPRVESAGNSSAQSACEPPAAVMAEPHAVLAADLTTAPTVDPGAGPATAWWERPGPRVWVDPQSGRLRQEQPAVRRMTDDRGRHR